MWFLIRAGFWFSMVLVMLPIFDQEATTRLKHEKGANISDAHNVASSALSYMGSICSEKPDVCIKGAGTVSTLGSRAREGARIAYTYLDGRFGDDKTTDAVMTGSLATRNDTIRNIPIPIPRPRA